MLTAGLLLDRLSSDRARVMVDSRLPNTSTITTKPDQLITVTTQKDGGVKAGSNLITGWPPLIAARLNERQLGQLGNGVGNRDGFVRDWWVSFRREAGNNIVIGWRGHF